MLLNIGTLLFPFLLSFDKKVGFYKKWKFVFPAIIINGLFFIVWDMVFTSQKVWGFNPDYILGYYIFNLPIEEVLFFICVPYSCVFIYEVLNAYIKKEIITHTKIINYALMILCLMLCILFYNKLYTLVNAGICLGLIVFSTYIKPFKNWSRFYLAYFVSLVPFLICNGILTRLPVVIYNNDENMAIRLLTIPVEDILYCFSMLLSTILIMEHFKTEEKGL